MLGCLVWFFFMERNNAARKAVVGVCDVIVGVPYGLPHSSVLDHHRKLTKGLLSGGIPNGSVCRSCSSMCIYVVLLGRDAYLLCNP